MAKIAASGRLGQLGEALNVDMRQWFEPNAENYFNHINRTGIEVAMNEAAGVQACFAVKAAAKKSEAALIAERLVKGTGWLPEHIRITSKPDTAAVVSIDDIVCDNDDDAHNESDSDHSSEERYEQAAE